MSNILIVDDNEDVLIAAKLLLKPFASVIVTEKDPNQIPKLISSTSFDVIFLDMNFTKDITSGQEGFYWLKDILQIDPLAVVILITAYGDVETAVRAVKEGATDFILKPWHNEKFIATLSSALKLRESRVELNKMKSRQKFINEENETGFHEIIGTSESMRKVFSTISKVAATDANVLILGENGTGKELVARALHRKSNRVSEAFISVDMGSISHSLFESELFGHVKGAFTDAKDERVGRFEIASGGTLFLDEISNIPLELQAKILTAIQSREITRVGSNKPIPIDIRLICATNNSLHDLIAQNKFRQDLLYRINTVEIDLPPLRERAGDIPLLMEHFMNIYKKKYNKQYLEADSLTLRNFENYAWPGNVREFQHAIERSIILCESNILKPSDCFFSSSNSQEKNSSEEYSTFNLELIEKQIIQKALLKFAGNISKAANELGLTRTSLYRRMEKYGL
ncbi:MAG: sigma-54 dependent transcriptional regulator [Bacteroidetes bacterium]|nr:sigma-54 dependent transcriptional regulator [Bacteroidota bacterium]MBU1115515.1 sigma-54 dependent transcriptional regulator [Bacteroidota bacterium]MBU1799567.1 sigma-54 dependent transcriptional regulator [Bacteroidota bacterium]